jgi:hypothetical protein
MLQAVASRRGLAISSLGGLATLLNMHRVEAFPYVGVADQVTPAASAGSHPPPYLSPDITTIDVRDFGAKGDGNTDDAAAINSAIVAVRARHRKIGEFDLGCRLLFPTGIYVVRSSIDLTGLRNINTVVDGGGSAILGRCKGKPVIDALGSRWLTMRDLTVLGDPTAPPEIGIQMGLVSKRVVADDHRFEDVKVLGTFELACLYNRAAETTGFDHVFLWNNHPNSFCLIQDGVNHFGVRSDFINVDIPLETGLSFNENEFINCDFRHGGHGTPVWLGDTARHEFIRCYATTEGGPAFLIYCGQNGHLMLDVDCHCETEGLNDVFRFSGPGAGLKIRCFSYRDHYCFANRTVFSCDDHVSHIELQNARIDIASFFQQGCRVFDRPSCWSVTGSYYSADAAPWNGGSSFVGFVTLGSNVGFFGNFNGSSKINTIPKAGVLSATDEGRLFIDKSNRLVTWTGSEWVNALGHRI